MFLHEIGIRTQMIDQLASCTEKKILDGKLECTFIITRSTCPRALCKTIRQTVNALMLAPESDEILHFQP